MKTCRICSKTLPESDFSNDPKCKDKLKSACKRCLYERSKLNPSQSPEHTRELRRLRLLSPIARAVYNRRKLDYYKRKRSEQGIPTLTRTEIHERSVTHHKMSQEQKLMRFKQRLLQTYGDSFFDFYLLHPFEPYTKDSAKQLLDLKLHFIETQTKISPANDAVVWRITELNKVAQLPLMNIGWHCLSCGLTHFHPALFEIDHIIPRSHQGSNHVSNKQILCPTCHKKKTLGILNVQVNQSFRNPNNLQLCFT